MYIYYIHIHIHTHLYMRRCVCLCWNYIPGNVNYYECWFEIVETAKFDIGGASLSDDGQESFLKKPSMELLFRTLEDRAGGGAPPTRRISVSPTWTVGQVKVL